MNAKLRHADLQGASLQKASIVSARLNRADLWRADIRESRLHRTDLSESVLSESDLSGADLFKAKLVRANLLKANLSGTKLNQVIFSEAELSYSILIGIREFDQLQYEQANFYGALIDNQQLIDHLKENGANNAPHVIRDMDELKKRLGDRVYYYIGVEKIQWIVQHSLLS
jgi:uncharacterized protein YjbI with pentapeptide repeats